MCVFLMCVYQTTGILRSESGAGSSSALRPRPRAPFRTAYRSGDGEKTVCLFGLPTRAETRPHLTDPKSFLIRHEHPRGAVSVSPYEVPDKLRGLQHSVFNPAEIARRFPTKPRAAASVVCSFHATFLLCDGALNVLFRCTPASSALDM